MYVNDSICKHHVLDGLLQISEMCVCNGKQIWFIGPS